MFCQLLLELAEIVQDEPKLLVTVMLPDIPSLKFVQFELYYCQVFCRSCNSKYLH